jgi:hypothetical protein
MRQMMGWAVLAVVLAVAGCSGTGTDDTQAGSAVRVNLAWGARTRALSSASSCVITLTDPASPSTTQHWTVNRQADPAAYTEEFVSPEVATQAWTLSLQFYAGADGTGSVVGTAQRALTIDDLFSPALTLAVTGTAAAVSVDAGQTVALTATKQLTCTVRDKDGAVLVVAPGAAVWSTLTTGVLTLTPDGLATGTALGTAWVTVSVDGITSYNTKVTVTE